MHICAECLDFMPCGDWDICCRQQVRRLTYEYSEACESMRPGREINPVVLAKKCGKDKAWKPGADATIDDCIEFARLLDGYTDVQIRDDKPEEMFPLLWREE